MRWALIRVSLAVTAMVVIAFAVPLGLVVKELARDRALTNAERQAAADRARARHHHRPGAAGARRRHHPGRRPRTGSRCASPPPPAHRPSTSAGTAPRRPRSTAASANGEAATVHVPGGYALLQPTAVSSGTIAVVEVFVPGRRRHPRGGHRVAGAGRGRPRADRRGPWRSPTGSAAVRSGRRYGWRAPPTDWARGTSRYGCRRPGPANCGRRQRRSTPWPTRSSNSWPTNGSWPPTSRTGCVPR